MKHLISFDDFSLNENSSNRDAIIYHFKNNVFTKETARQLPYEVLSKFEKYFHYSESDFEKLSDDELSKIWDDWTDENR